MFRFLLPLAIAAGAVQPAFAQDDTAPPGARTPSASAARALTLADALALAARIHPGLSAAQHEIEAVDGARAQAGAHPNPTIGLEIENAHRDERTTTLLLSQPLELGGKRGARIEAAERARDIAALQFGQRSAELRANVTAAYFAALIAQERLRLAEGSLALARTSHDTAGKRVAAGKVSPVEETRSRVAQASVALDVVQARGELQTSLHALRAAIGSQNVAIDRLDGSADALPPAPSLDDLDARLAQAPATRLAALEVQRYGALAQLEQARRVPDLTLSLGAKRTPELDGRNEAVLGLSMPLPIFDSNSGNITEALRREDKARDEAAQTALQLRADALSAHQRLSTARTEALAIRQEVLPGAQSAFEAATKGFELGKFSFLESLDAQRTLLQARAQYLRSLADAHRAATDLDRLLGRGAEQTTLISQEQPAGVQP